MCFILIVFQAHERYPLIVAANRDEARSRPTQSPCLWPDTPALWAGRDEIAGGTWLGVNAMGLLAAVTNRPTESIDRTLPSRGLLCLEILRQPTPHAAATLFADTLKVERFNPFNLLCANTAEGWVSTWRGDLARLAPGIHVLTNRGELDDPTLPVVQRARRALNHPDLSAYTLDDILSMLKNVCSDTTGPDPICRVGGSYGTVSSSIIAIAHNGAVAAYQHVEGPPSESAFSSLVPQMGPICDGARQASCAVIP